MSIVSRDAFGFPFENGPPWPCTDVFLIVRTAETMHHMICGMQQPQTNLERAQAIAADVRARKFPALRRIHKLRNEMIKCEKCSGTGETGHYGALDCTAPGCTAATERSAFNTLIGALPAMTPYDLQWTAYQLGRAMAEKELVDALRSMWGHAIELGETDYFDDPQFGKVDWSADCEAAAKLIQSHSK